MKKSPNGIESESGARSLLQTNHGAVFQGTGCGHGHATDDEELSPAAERAISHLLVRIKAQNSVRAGKAAARGGNMLAWRNQKIDARVRFGAVAEALL